MEMRRPISTTNPMWLIHIDSSFGEDAQQCIDAVPKDVLPYVVFNISVTNPDKYALIEQCLQVCEANNVFSMVQNSAGSRNSMSDTDVTQYEKLFKTYPHLIGYNFSEQGWGLYSGALDVRLELFCDLLEVARKYGGYLYVNDEHSVANSALNPVAKMKQSKKYAEYTRVYANNFIYGDKTTMGSGYYDNESACLGMFLSGHAGHYAVRFDMYGWSYSGHGQVFGAESSDVIPNSLAWFSCPEAVMGIHIVELMMMTGATIIDGPEIPIITCMFGGRITPAFKNMVCDIFRQVVNKNIFIPTREEVLERTKFAYVCNGSYPHNVTDPLYEGLYQMDGELKANKTWLKKSGRYPTIPSIYDYPADGLFQFCVAKRSPELYTDRWPTTEDKLTELNSIYPEVSTGDLYVGRFDSHLLAYNPYMNINQDASASIPLQNYDGAKLDLVFTPHTFSVINEKDGGLYIYLNNYRTDKDELWAQYPSISEDDKLPRMTQATVQEYMRTTFIDHPTHQTLRRSVVTITGCREQPSYTIRDRGDHEDSECIETYSNGTLTLEIEHNGPLELSINYNTSTGIRNVQTSTGSDIDDAIYTLQGVRVYGPVTPGIYIQGGKKIVIKNQ